VPATKLTVNVLACSCNISLGPGRRQLEDWIFNNSFQTLSIFLMSFFFWLFGLISLGHASECAHRVWSFVFISVSPSFSVYMIMYWSKFQLGSWLGFVQHTVLSWCKWASWSSFIWRWISSNIIHTWNSHTHADVEHTHRCWTHTLVLYCMKFSTICAFLIQLCCSG